MLKRHIKLDPFKETTKGKAFWHRSSSLCLEIISANRRGISFLSEKQVASDAKDIYGTEV